MRTLIYGVAFAALLFTLTAVYAQEQKEGEPKAQPPEQKPSWTESVRINGDLRYRHETIMKEDERESNRHRIRARVGADAKINENINSIFRLATCSSPEGDPASTNQTLTDGFSHKYIWLDLAYFEARPEQVKGLTVYGGRMKNLFLALGESDLIWDHDVALEGLAVKYSLSLGRVEPSFTAGGFWVTERADDADSWLPAGQGSLNIELRNNTCLRFGIGYFDYQAAKGYETFYSSAKSFGNTVDAGGNYANDFDELETFVEVCFRAGRTPVSIFADCVENLDAKRNDAGYLTGVTVGKTREPGDWAIKCSWRKLEKDAVIGAFTDSVYWGNGTDGRSIKVRFDIMVVKNTTVSATVFFSKNDLDTKEDYRKFQFDIVFKF